MQKKSVVTIAVFMCGVFFTSFAYAESIQIFGVRKNLTLSDDEPVYRDFYLNAGSNKGLKKGMVVTVMRSETLYDSYQNKSPGDLLVPVGKVKIIHTQPNISVARVFSKVNRRNMPLLDYNYIMVGDHVDLKSAYMDRGRKKAKSAQTTIKKQKTRELSSSFRSTLEGATQLASEAPRAPQIEVNKQL